MSETKPISNNSRRLSGKALPMIESMHWRDGVFNSMLLKAKLLSKADTEVAETLLLSMAEQFTEQEYAAYINRELYRNKGDEEHRKEPSRNSPNSSNLKTRTRSTRT